VGSAADDTRVENEMVAIVTQRNNVQKTAYNKAEYEKEEPGHASFYQKTARYGSGFLKRIRGLQG